MVEFFPKAPITEAVIDIRTELPEGVSLTDLEDLHARVKAEYPRKQKRMILEGAVNVGEGKEPFTTARHQVIGYLFTSGDGTQVVQFRLDGFSFSRLRPYTRWEQIYPQAKQLWDVFRSRTKPVRVTRLATRYINSIEIPSKKFDYDDYFSAAPRIPPGLPQLLIHFLTRLVIPFPDDGAVAIVTQMPDDKPDPINSPVILDIDVFADVSLAAEDVKIDDIFAKLRRIKNDIFFTSITERAEGLFR